MVWSNSSAHTKTSRRGRQVGGDESDMFALCVGISWEKLESLARELFQHPQL
ncbi:hypothetical protein GHT06_011529 [Daphnia sinensis]|uniref:Uncharacterized protein n=1 Tax=Daphnia sinensis TaxID=1820382 RepID=A0AAD5PUM8_9CRUS|nr:hypothetical protein GHT06_011529 [Daphnia sinensis]